MSKMCRKRYEGASNAAAPMVARFASIRARNARKLRTTPFGVPVVPDVNSNSAGFSGSGIGKLLAEVLASP